jgi:hypothetical protein
VKQLLIFAGLSIALSSCARTEHYYRAEAAYDMYARKSAQSSIQFTIRQGDTIVSDTRLHNPNGRFVRIRHGSNSGYVQFWGQQYLSSAKSGVSQPTGRSIATTK